MWWYILDVQSSRKANRKRTEALKNQSVDWIDFRVPPSAPFGRIRLAAMSAFSFVFCMAVHGAVVAGFLPLHVFLAKVEAPTVSLLSHGEGTWHCPCACACLVTTAARLGPMTWHCVGIGTEICGRLPSAACVLPSSVGRVLPDTATLMYAGRVVWHLCRA